MMKLKKIIVIVWFYVSPIGRNLSCCVLLQVHAKTTVGPGDSADLEVVMPIAG